MSLGGTEIALALAATSLLATGAAMLSQQGADGDVRPDQRPTTVANRGGHLPLLFGRRRLSPVFCWAGQRRAEEVESGGKSLGGNASGTSYSYEEAAMHALCIGPCGKRTDNFMRLYGIYQSGKRIYPDKDTPYITSESTDTADGGTYKANGSTLTCEQDQGEFKIYWGYANQGLNSTMAGSTYMNFDSAWRPICYVFWNRKFLGTSPTWPDLVYDIEQRPQYRIPGTTPEGQAWGDHTTWFGVNPAHVLWQIITAPYPYGAGVPKGLCNLNAFIALSDLFNTEKATCNFLTSSENKVTDIIGNLMSDFGFIMPQIGGLLCPRAIRAVDFGDIPEITSDCIVPNEAEVIRIHQEDQSNRMVFVYDDVARRFRGAELTRDDDGLAVSRRNINPKKINLYTVSDRYNANIAAQRKILESFCAGQMFKLKMSRGARRLVPGQAFYVDGIGYLRAVSISLSAETSLVEVEAALDQYSLDQEDYTPDDIADPPIVGDETEPVADDYMLPKIDQRLAGAGTPQFAVVRVRDNKHITGSKTLLSDGVNTSYSTCSMSQDTTWFGGTLDDSISSGQDKIKIHYTAMVGTVTVSDSLTQNVTGATCTVSAIDTTNQIATLTRTNSIDFLPGYAIKKDASNYIRTDQGDYTIIPITSKTGTGWALSNNCTQDNSGATGILRAETASYIWVQVKTGTFTKNAADLIKKDGATSNYFTPNSGGTLTQGVATYIYDSLLYIAEITYTSKTGSPVVGDLVTQTNSGATGIVTADAGSVVTIEVLGGTFTNAAVDTIVKDGAAGSYYTPNNGVAIGLGPEFTPYNDDTNMITDLSAATADSRWRSTEQICVIGDEWFSIQNILPTSGGKYRLVGLRRKQYGSSMASHASPDPACIILASKITWHTHPLLQWSDTLQTRTFSVKVLPSTTFGVLAEADATAQTLTMP